MKMLIFSDLHGNVYALEELVKKKEFIECEYKVFCGDIFGYYYDQNKIFDILKNVDNLIWVKGNHDEYMINIYDKIVEEKYFVGQYGSSYQNAKKKYNEENIELIKRLENKKIVCLENKKIGIFHGTPEDPLEGRLYPNTEIMNPCVYEKFDIVILGHTHCRMLRKSGDTLIINSGSLGQPRDGNQFGYAILDIEKEIVEFYDICIKCDELYNKIDKYDKNLLKLRKVLERREK